MNKNLFDPFAWWIIIPAGIAMTLLQLALMGNPGTVTSDQLGKLGK